MSNQKKAQSMAIILSAVLTVLAVNSATDKVGTFIEVGLVCIVIIGFVFLMGRLKFHA